MNTKSMLCLLFLLFPCNALAGYENFETAADTYLTSMTRQGEFSAAVLVASHGESIFARGYGFANREYNIANTTGTIFLIGSVTKQFTAMGILLLQKQGRLHVEDAVSKHLKNCPPAWTRITIHQLLTHTAGIPNFTEFKERPDLFEILPATAGETIAMFKDRPLDFEPGAHFHYSNSGYVLLGQIIENVSGDPYGQFLHDHIFQPLGMSDTGFYHPATILPNRASGYSREEMRVVNCFPPPTEMLQGAGALYSTVADLLRWDEALYSNRLVGANTLQAMFTPYRDGFGYGWFRSSIAGRLAFQHNGSLNGFNCRVARFPEDHLYIAVLANFDWTESAAIADKLGRLFFGVE